MISSVAKHYGLLKHYEMLLGLGHPWRVADVELSPDVQRLEIRVEHLPGLPGCCSGCARQLPLKDSASQQSWRHLNTMQFETILIAEIPRVDCPECGLRFVDIPWGELDGRFTTIYESCAIRLL